MNRTVIILIGLSFLGCTITVTPLPQSKKTHRSTKHTVKSKPISKNVKETWWVENYYKLEAAHGNYKIPDDAKIEPLADGRFKVPDTVLTHYQDLLLTSPSPTP